MTYIRLYRQSPSARSINTKATVQKEFQEGILIHLFVMGFNLLLTHYWSYRDVRLLWWRKTSLSACMNSYSGYWHWVEPPVFSKLVGKLSKAWTRATRTNGRHGGGRFWRICL